MNGQANVLGMYEPGGSLLHRSPAELKLLGLCVFGTAVVLARSVTIAVLALLVAVGLAASSRMNLRRLGAALQPLLIISALVLVLHWWQTDLMHGVQIAARLLAVVILATTITATTSSDAIVDAVIRAATPLRAVGVQPERIGLAMALMLNAIPGLLTIALETREAARARGLGHDPRALLVPFVLRSVAHARAAGEALAARGVGD
ncbi:energy-coupling factor transporter transmembrane protein EcfT [Hoyosella sp. YIM 151337]|uniref:energy-coupling factor transporter transmembrane component T family protein n=1 Tax=Hoyosella sp. YIM 151337 TaxID=2992742 RepID=UPI0022364C71|nr:energy-coupling factor transporter transmembrane protein EcfT [Hoyosella sp. YIM 151337]MCW4351739.1 energy-coupling factor transporter transmembrane protein EcfT [Hoyosella sp. YIM 151337]